MMCFFFSSAAQPEENQKCGIFSDPWVNRVIFSLLAAVHFWFSLVQEEELFRISEIRISQCTYKTRFYPKYLKMLIIRKEFSFGLCPSVGRHGGAVVRPVTWQQEGHRFDSRPCSPSVWTLHNWPPRQLGQALHCGSHPKLGSTIKWNVQSALWWILFHKGFVTSSYCC